MERKASSAKNLAKAASASSKELVKTPSKAAAAEPAPSPAPAMEKAASKKDLARSKSKSKESIAPAAPEAPAPPMVKAPSKEKAAPVRSASKEKEAAGSKRKSPAPLSLGAGLNGSYWTTAGVAKIKRSFTPSAFAPAPTKSYKRAAPVAGGLRKNKPTYGKLVQMALGHLGDSRKGHTLVEIRKWIESRYPVPDNSTRRIRLALTSAVNSKLVSRHGLLRYKLTAKAAKKTRAKKTTKKTGAKKTKTASTKSAKPAKKAVKKSAGGKVTLAKKASAAAPALMKKLSSQIAAAAYGAGRPAPVQVGAAYAAFKKNFIWQYKDNAGKWANYDPAASDIVEGCYEEYQANPHMMDVRAVHSGDWQYQVDFIQMKQTNIQHEAHRVRDIRRVENPKKN